ncbi:MAG: hypothetical protein WD013_04575, partial [Gemmatimonadota bacterium]
PEGSGGTEWRVRHGTVRFRRWVVSGHGPFRPGLDRGPERADTAAAQALGRKWRNLPLAGCKVKKSGAFRG